MKKSPSRGKKSKEKTKVKAAAAKTASRKTARKVLVKSKSGVKKAGPKPKLQNRHASSKVAKPGKKIAAAKAKTAKRIGKRTAKTAVRRTAKIPVRRAVKSSAPRSAAKPLGRNTAKVAAKRPIKLSARATAKRPIKVIAKRVGRPKRQPVKSSPVTGKVSTVNLKSRSGAKVTVPIVISTPPPPPEPPRRQVSSGALRAFDQAVKVFNRRHFEDAQEMFEQLITKFPNDVEVVARAQMYIQVCKQKIESTPSTPGNADELYDRGVFALNIGDFSQARQFFEKALRLRPDEPYLLYSLAATHAQSGALEQALDCLKRSIQLQPRLRSQAYNDADFVGLRENKRFLEMLGLTSPFDLLESKR